MNISPTSPKEQWLADKTASEKWAEIVADPVFKKAMTYAFAQFAASCSDSTQIKGATSFRMQLVQLSEPPSTGRMPSKQLKER